MRVEDGLTGVGAGVGDESVVVQTIASGDVAGQPDQRRQRVGFGVRQRTRVGVVGPGHDEGMGRRLGVHVAEGQRLSTLTHHVRRDLAGHDPAEQAVGVGGHAAMFPPGWAPRTALGRAEVNLGDGSCVGLP